MPVATCGIFRDIPALATASNLSRIADLRIGWAKLGGTQSMPESSRQRRT